MRYDIFERSYSGFENETQAEEWLDQVEYHFQQSFENWDEWTVTTVIGGIPTPGKIRAEFRAEYNQ